MSDPEEQSSKPYTSLDEVGHWYGKRFIFNEPVKVATDDGREITLVEIDTTGMVLGDGIDPDDVIHALLNPVHAEEL